MWFYLAGRRTSIGSVISAVTAFSAGAKPELLMPGRVAVSSPVVPSPGIPLVGVPDRMPGLQRPKQPTRRRLSLQPTKLALEATATAPVDGDGDVFDHNVREEKRRRNFDIRFMGAPMDHFSRICQRCATPHARCAPYKYFAHSKWVLTGACDPML